MKLSRIFFLIYFFSNSFYLYAQQYEYVGNCNFNGNTEIFESCLDSELSLYDKELNKLYKKITNNSDKRIKKIESLWIQFKEADCNYMADEVNEGLEYEVIKKICLINKTKIRIADLKRSFFYSGWIEKKFN